MRAVFMVLAAAVTLSACSSSEPRLMPKSGLLGPDEFALLPGKPLQTPTSLTELPLPTPGGSNLTDQTPKSDAIAALGGRDSTGASDGALVNYVSRYGTAPEIRSDLAAADLSFRSRKDGWFQGLFGGNRYFKAYRRQALDEYAELARLRALGIETPSAPPVE
jgi:Protein of unknown function (DUF3035)